MPSDVLITPATSKIDFTDGANSTKKLSISGTAFSFNSNLNVLSSTSLSSAFKAEGVNGTLFEVTDDLSNSLMSVNTIGGLPVFEVFANNSIIGGQYGANDFVISGNKIGLGYANPVNKLTVSGSVSIGSSYNVAAPSNGLIVQGDVGIGTATPTAQTDYRFLQVNGPVSAVIETTVAGVRIGGFDSNSSTLFVGTIGAFPIVFRTGVNEKWRITAAGILESNGLQTIRTNTGNLTLATALGNGHILLSPHGTGNVGIGTVTPRGKLEISNTGGSRLIVYETGPSTATLELSSNTYGTYGGTMQYDYNAETLTIQNYGGTATNSVVGSIVFKTKINNTTATNVMLINGFTGNVGIATLTPSEKLEVVGVIKGTSFSGAGTGLTGTASNLTAGTANALNAANGYTVASLTAAKGTFSDASGVGSVLQVYNTVATNATTAIIRQTTAGGNGNQDIGLLVDIQGSNDLDRIANFRYYDGSAFTSRMVIVRGGNVGIGVTNPGSKLDVVGNINIDGPSFHRIANDSIITAPSDHGLVAYYGFDEGSSLLISDKTGRNNTSALGLTYTTTAIRGTALDGFGGNNNYVVVPDSTDFDFGTGDFAVSLWCRPNSSFTNSLNTLMEIGLYTAGMLIRPHSNTLEIYIQGSFITGPTIVWAANVWYHIVVTRISSVLNVYSNGTRITSVANTSNIQVSSAGYIGRSAHNVGQFFYGIIDEVKIYKGKGLDYGEVRGQYLSRGDSMLVAPIFSTTNGNIGIGKTSPRVLLDLAKANNVAQVLLLGETSANIRVGFGLNPSNAGMRIFSYNHISDGLIEFGGISSDGSTWTRNHRLGLAGGNSFFNEQGGNVGIGNTSPNNKLAISGSASIGSNYNTAAPTNGLIVEGSVGIGKTTIRSNSILDVNGAGCFGSSGYGFYIGTDATGTFLDAGTQLIRMFAGQVERMRIATDGNIGIGVTSVAAKLHVNSTTSGATLLRADGTNGTLFSVVDDLSDSLMSVNNSAGLPVLEVFADDRVVAGQYGANDFVLINNKLGLGTSSPANKLTVIGAASIGSSTYNVAAPSNGLIVQGNVGIGVTTNPESKLQVNGEVRIASSSSYFTHLNYLDGGSNLISSSNGGSTLFRGSANNLTSMVVYGSGTVSTNYNTYLAATSGNVGIGTSSPGGKLEVRTNAASTYIFSGTSTSGYTTSFTMDDTASYFGHDSSVRSLILRTNSISRLTVTGDGNIGIGTTSPTAKLDVANGGLSVSGWSNNNSGSTGGVEIGWDGSQGIFQVYDRVNNNYEPILINGSAIQFFISGGLKWTLSTAGVLQSNNTQTIQTSTGNLTLATAAGNGHVLLSPHGTGNVGIGTTSPGAKLDVVGSTRLTSNLLSHKVASYTTPYPGISSFGADATDANITYYDTGKLLPNTNFRGVVWTGKHYIFVTTGSSLAYFYDNNFNLITNSYGLNSVSLPLPSGYSYPHGAAWDGRYLWVVCYVDGETVASKIVGYDLDSPSGNAAIIAESAPLTNMTAAYDIEYADGHFYMVRFGSVLIYRWNGSTIDLINTIVGEAGSITAQAITYDGSYLWATQNGAEIYKLGLDGYQEAVITTGFPPDVCGWAWNGSNIVTFNFSARNIYIINTTRLRIDTQKLALMGGNVGIGTISPNNKLVVVAGGDVSGINLSYDGTGNNRTGLFAWTRGSSLASLGGGVEYTAASTFTARSTAASYVEFGSGETRFYGNGSLTSGTGFTPTERVRISAIGNVGIGTTAPYTNLDVQGLTDASLGAMGLQSQLSVSDSRNQIAGVGGGISFTGKYITSNATQTVFGLIRGAKANSTTANVVGDLELYAFGGSFKFHSQYNQVIGSNAVLMTLTAVGNLGIGTATPNAKLNILSTSSLSSVFKTEGVNGTLFEVTDDLSNSLMSVNTIGGLPVFEVFANNSIIAGQYGQNDFVISGNKVGIGTASPSYKLHVNGSLGVNAGTSDGNWPFIVVDSISSGGSNRYALNKIGAMGFNYADSYAQLQLIGANGAYIDFGNAAIDDSDARIIYHSNNRFDISYGTTITLNSTGAGVGVLGPSAKLHVQTTAGSVTAPNVVAIFQANTDTTILAGGGTAIKFRGVSSGGNLQDYDQCMISSLGYAGNNQHGMQFWVKPNAGTVLTAALTINNDSSVVANSSVTAASFSGLGTNLTGTASSLTVGTATIATTATTANALNTGNSYTVTNLTATGSVGIGTTSTLQKLHVLGNTVFGNFGRNTYKYNLYLSFEAAADESWIRIYLPQDYSSTNNGGTVKVRVLWAGDHATFGAHEEYQISYKTYYPSPYLAFSNIICTNKTTDFAGATYYPASSTPNSIFYSNGSAYLYIKIKGYYGTINTTRFIEAEVFGRVAAVPTIETTTAPASPTELLKTIQFLPQEGNVIITGSLTGSLIGNVTGNVTGNVSGSSGTCNGLAASATTAATCTGNAAGLSATLAVASGGTGGNTQALGRAGLGATTVGANLFTLANPGAITFPRINADNTVTALTDAQFRTAIGVGTGGGSGTVTGVTASAPLASSEGTAPNISLSGAVALANGGSGQTSAQAAMNAFAGAVTNTQYLRGNGTNVVMSAIQVIDVPILNQNTTGSSASCSGTAATANALNTANNYTVAQMTVSTSATPSSYVIHTGTSPSAIRLLAYTDSTYIQSGTSTSSSSADLVFSSMQAGAEWMRIKGATGRLGIGTSTPAYLLDVNGTIHYTALQASSDGRFKKNVQPIPNALDRLSYIRGVKFEWNEFINDRRNGYELNKPTFGVIAQELEEVFPELITLWKLSDDCTDARSVNYEKIIPILIEAVKELNDKNKLLESRLLILENK